MNDEQQENKPEPPPESPQERAARRRSEILELANELHRKIIKLREDCLLSPLWDLLQQHIAKQGAVDGGPCLASPSDNLMRVVSDMLPDTYNFDERGIVRRAHGILLTQTHSWFVVELPGEDVGEPSPWWRFIIDPAVPDASPQCILLGPGSPMQLAYRDQRDYPEDPTSDGSGLPSGS